MTSSDPVFFTEFLTIDRPNGFLIDLDMTIIINTGLTYGTATLEFLKPLSGYTQTGVLRMKTLNQDQDGDDMTVRPNTEQ